MNKLLQKLVPKFIKGPLQKKKLKETILSYYNSIDKDLVDDEKVTALNYLKEKGFSIFPDPFQEKYKRSDIKVHTNPINNLKYVITNEKQLYFKRNSSKRGVRRNYNSKD